MFATPREAHAAYVTGMERLHGKPYHELFPQPHTMKPKSLHRTVAPSISVPRELAPAIKWRAAELVWQRQEHEAE